MSRILSVLVSVLAVALPVFAEDPELLRFAGKWTQVSVEGDGILRQSGPNPPGMMISGDLWIETSPAGEAANRFTINPKKNPPQIDRTMGFGNQTVVIPGIYTLESDTLRISMPIPFGGRLNVKRPTAFATKPGDPFTVTIYRRTGAADVLKPLAWQGDWNSAFASAKEHRRLVFVDFFAEWCKPCHEMEETVFILPSVRDKLADFELLRIDVDKNNIARAQNVSAFPTYGVYDPGERIRFRMIGGKPPMLFRNALDEIHSVAAKLINASDLFDQKKDVEAQFLVGNTYMHLGMNDQARDAYAEARKIAVREGQNGSAQLADTLSAFTVARDGNPSRALKQLEKLAAHPADRDTEALIWLTIGNVHRLAKETKAAADAYAKTQSLTAPDSTAYKEAAAAIASLQ